MIVEYYAKFSEQRVLTKIKLFLEHFHKVYTLCTFREKDSQNKLLKL